MTAKLSLVWGRWMGLGLLLLGASQASAATTILIDFGNPTVTTTSDANGLWNNLSDPTITGVISNLITTTGASTGYTLAVTNQFNFYNTGGGTSGSSLYAATVTSDSFYGNTAAFDGGRGPLSNLTPQLTLSGLNTTSTYSLTFYASRTGVGDNRSARYTVTGGNGSTFADLDAANNVNNTVTISGLTSTGGGNLVIDLAAAPSNTNGSAFVYIGALTITETAVPEPSTYALAGVGLLFLAWRLRRRATF